MLVAALSATLVVKVSTERLPQLAQRYQVNAIPNFKVFVGGNVATERAGAMRANELRALVEQSRQ